MSDRNISPPAAPEASARASAVQARQSPDVVGAGAYGMWTALHLQRLGARVQVVDAYGAGNSRQTSGGETRGVRTSYGDRRHGRQWSGWAQRAIGRWLAWDEAGRDRLLPRLFRISMGHVFYFAVPPGDTRFTYPFMPSYGVPGCTGWPALPPDHRGFRV